MSEQFNQEVSLSSKIPTGHFNAAFEFTGCWQKDAANTKTLALDGVFITIYSIALEKSQITLCDHIKEAVPSSWDPAALVRWVRLLCIYWVFFGVLSALFDIFILDFLTLADWFFTHYSLNVAIFWVMVFDVDQGWKKGLKGIIRWWIR